MPTILVFAGSLRKDSFNKKFARIAAKSLEQNGATITFIDLKEMPMPVYDGDIQDSTGLPETAIQLKKLIREADGVLISTPEYNYSIPGALKNVIDWTSRSHEKGEPAMAVYNNKLFALISASMSPAGGIRGQLALRECLNSIGAILLPGQVTLGKAHEGFNDDGTLKDARTQGAVDAVAKQLVEVAGKLK